MKKALFIALVLSAFVAVGCTSVDPLAVSSNNVGSKVGEATGRYLFGFPLGGADASIQTAARNAGISQVSTVDVRTFNILGVWMTKTTVITGD